MPEQLQLREYTAQGTVTLSLTGELDIATSHLLEEAAERLGDQEAAEVLLDLSGVSFIDTTGLRAILACKERFQTADRDFWVLSAPPQARRTFQLCGMLDQLPIRDVHAINE